MFLCLSLHVPLCLCSFVSPLLTMFMWNYCPSFVGCLLIGLLSRSRVFIVVVCCVDGIPPRDQGPRGSPDLCLHDYLSNSMWAMHMVADNLQLDKPHPGLRIPGIACTPNKKFKLFFTGGLRPPDPPE